MNSPFFIKVPIECFSKDSNSEEIEQMKRLGIDVNVEPKVESRDAYLQPSQISVFHPYNEDESKTMIEMNNGLTYIVWIPFKSFASILRVNNCTFL